MDKDKTIPTLSQTTVIRSAFYTPTIEEFHVGFECEWQSKIRKESWSKQICDVDLVNIAYSEVEHADEDEPFGEQFRVKYIDKDDLYELQFCPILIGEILYYGYGISEFEGEVGSQYIIHTFWQIKMDDDFNLQITKTRKNIKTDVSNTDSVFIGRIKNITELKRILMQVGYLAS